MAISASFLPGSRCCTRPTPRLQALPILHPWVTRSLNNPISSKSTDHPTHPRFHTMAAGTVLHRTALGLLVFAVGLHGLTYECSSWPENPRPGYYCKTILTGGSYYHVPIQCPAGKFCPGDGSSRVCPEGSYCPIGSPTHTACPEGSYCPIGSPTHTACLASGSSAVLRGYFCPAESASPDDKRACPTGSYCSGGNARPAPCSSAPQHNYCPAGNDPAASGLTSANGIFCPKGFYCSGGTEDKAPCDSAPQHNYCPAGGDAAASGL
eukprot:665283-Rhodomonas_salina.1